jgi:hypothetical protein
MQANRDDKLGLVKRLHEVYQLLTGLVVPLDSWREHQWFELVRKGVGEAELRLVIAHIRRGIGAGTRNRGALRFHNLIGQVDYFEEELAEATAVNRRARGDTARESVLRATGREGEVRSPKSEVRSISQVAAVVVGDPEKAAAALDELRNLKASL